MNANLFLSIAKLYSQFPQIKNLSLSQKIALMQLLKGKHLWISGEPGTGKTHLIFLLKEIFEELNISYAATATTGAASKRIGGRTVTSLLRLGINQFSEEEIIQKNSNNQYANIDILIIDESSMLSVQQFEQIDIALKSAKNSKLPFGGVQIVLVGDDCQLEPMEGEPLLLNVPKNFVQVDLEENFRQKDDPIFISILKEMRKEVKKKYSVMSLNLRKRILSLISNEEKEGILLSSNYEFVNKINHEKISNLEGERMTYYSSYDEGGQIPPYENQTYVEGMQVLHIINKDGLVNGDIGVILEVNCLRDAVYVEFLNGRTECIKPSSFSTKKWTGNFETITSYWDEDEEEWIEFQDIRDHRNEKVYEFFETEYIPLIPCYALTVRRAQGMTISQGNLDILNILNDLNPRLRYTALSRFMKMQDIGVYQAKKERVQVASLVA